VGVIVSVGVMVGPGGSGVPVQVAVVEGVGVREGVSEGVALGVCVADGVTDGVTDGALVAVAVAAVGAAVGTVGEAVHVGVELGLGLVTVGERAETWSGVGLAPQPATSSATSTRITKAANAPVRRVSLDHRQAWLLDRLDCGDSRCFIGSSGITSPSKSC
jgi:hypothetical protein